MPYKNKFPRTRLATIDLGIAALRKHHVVSLLELDVTDARREIRRWRRETGTQLSFNAWIIKTVSRVLQDFPEAHAYRGYGRELTLFENIDITVMVERLIEGSPVPLAYVIRHTEQKGPAQITAELEKIRASAGRDTDVVLGRESGFLYNLYFILPGCVRRIFWKGLAYFPKFLQRQMGSAIITNIGMMGKVNGWFIPKTLHPVSVGIGSIVDKPGVVKGRVVPREILHMTVLLDHDVIDGAQMARFIQRLSNLIESGKIP